MYPDRLRPAADTDGDRLGASIWNDFAIFVGQREEIVEDQQQAQFIAGLSSCGAG